jgi:hypothetical protein
MQEAVTLKPNSKFKKKKYGALGNLILKRLVPSPFFQKNHRSEKKCEGISFIYTEEKIGMQATRNYSLPSGQVAIPKISRYISAS